MPLDWRLYDEFHWSGAHQTPMNAAHRAGIENLVARLLDLSPEDRDTVWGVASPPGRYAATVVRVSAGLKHRDHARASLQGIAQIGVKVFKRNRDAQREAVKVLPFHRDGVYRLPGLPNPHVQRSLHAGTCRDLDGVERYYIVQEWVPGNTLEDWLRPREAPQAFPGTIVRPLLEQLFGGIIIPIWNEGTIWWDIRDANLCWDAASGRLTLIDTDALAAYLDEIVGTPDVWTKRDKGRETALTRLRGVVLRLLLAGSIVPRSTIVRELRAAWDTELEPSLRALGRERSRKGVLQDTAFASQKRFCDRLARAGLIIESCQTSF